MSIEPVGARRPAETVKRLGREAGFDLVRIAPAQLLESERAHYRAWIRAGRQGEMRWINDDLVVRSTDPEATLPGAQSVISVAVAYWDGDRPADVPTNGRVARYAWHPDYHRVLTERMEKFAVALQSEFGGDHRWFVDTGPAMDKAHAQRAGIGWYGKNTNILTAEHGSFVLLGEILTTLRFPHDAALLKDCGACRLCVVACPTGALRGDYMMDARKCISYLTIEHRGPIPVEFREAMRNWVFGCDICQDVCPPTMEAVLPDREARRRWRQTLKIEMRPRESTGGSPNDPKGRREDTSDPRRAPDLEWLLSLTHQDYLDAFRGTSVRRAKVWMLRRNAAVALANIGGREAVSSLARALKTDENHLVRGHAAWGIARLARRHPGLGVRDQLLAALKTENDDYVRSEIASALATLPDSGSHQDADSTSCHSHSPSLQDSQGGNRTCA